MSLMQCIACNAYGHFDRMFAHSHISFRKKRALSVCLLR